MTVEEHMRDVLGFWRVWVIHLGRRYRILHLLAGSDTPITASEASEKLSLNPEALQAWFEAARALGLVRRVRSGYKLPQKAARLLVDEDDPDFVGGLLSYYALRSLDFQGFDKLFGWRDNQGQDALTQAFAEGTKWDHTAFTKILLPRLPALQRTLREGSAVLDLGCGAGGWIAKLAPLYPKTMFVGVDPDPKAIEQAKKRCSGMGNTRFLVGAAQNLDYRDAFDIIYLGEVLYIIPEKEEVLRACHRALRPGGKLIVCEALLEDKPKTRRDRVGEAIVKATALEYMLQGGGAIERRRLLELLRQAGFHRNRGYRMPGGLWFYVSQK